MSFNANNSALLVVDVQRGLFRRPTSVYKEEELLNNICTLVREAHESQVLVVFVQQFNKLLHQDMEAYKLHPMLEARTGDVIIRKNQSSAFKETTLMEQLQKRNINRVIVTGLVTQGCIKSTCLDAKKRGFEVVLVEDGHSNYNQNAEEVINQWNKTLREENVTILKSEDIHFI